MKQPANLTGGRKAINALFAAIDHHQTKRQNVGKKWFCLSSNGQLYLVGRFETFEEADTEAANQGHDVIWLIDEETAEQWKKTLL